MNPQAYGRRKVLQGAALIAGAGLLGGGSLTASAAAAAFDPRQRFLKLIPAGNGVLYALQADGTLFYYRHTGWADGAASWSPGAGFPIGDGFHQFADVLADADGTFYCRTGSGALRRYHYSVSNPATGEGQWTDGGGTQIGNGFQQYPRIFGGWDGVLYCVDPDGGLWWYRWTSAGWINGGAGVRIGSGFKQYQTLTAGPDGVIYGVRQGGDLHWFRFNPDGATWANGGNPYGIGSGWGEGFHKQVLSDNAGCVYAVSVDRGAVPVNDDTLHWYRLLNARTVASDGGPRWVNGNATAVGSGFSVEASGALQGYASSLTVRPGERISFPISTSLAGVTASVIRLPSRASVSASASVASGLQTLPASYRTSGCGWSERFSASVTWSSGVYALEMRTPGGLRRHIPFVVRPSAPASKIAFLLPTNTYNAYNIWGGHNQYSEGEAGRQRQLTFMRPSSALFVDAPGRIDHLLYSDLFLLKWMEDNGLGYDAYIDGDLDADGTWLRQYKALVLGSHPEYWTDVMRQRVAEYLAGGGRLIYTGGNGLYERMSYANGTTALHRAASGGRDEFHQLGKSESQILGVALTGAYMDFYPYEVVSDHPLLAGTGLRPGSQFGAYADNGAASGWEVDALNPAMSGVQHIARGTNPGGGADMVFWPKPNGGWVFSASSMSFNGALPHDAAIRRILRNVFDLALR
ncbi:N,N-dimethylformamidase beta subunit family domain-containing protein [Lentzea sp. JNUCC 0626]|uniref:N,N-dimethylformamidase beta subunit family domain-containing protein n=1 Tax=Lentzea sp. JNUCC 0626 TaxID=3367513 RepID=UPI00374A7379